MPQAEAVALLGDVRADLIVYGHIHYASAGSVRGQRLASLGSVGFPFDGDRRAAYAVLRWDGLWQVEHRRVAYNVERVVDEVRRSGQPDAEREAQMLLQANWLPRDT